MKKPQISSDINKNPRTSDARESIHTPETWTAEGSAERSGLYALAHQETPTEAVRIAFMRGWARATDHHRALLRTNEPLTIEGANAIAEDVGRNIDRIRERVGLPRADSPSPERSLWERCATCGHYAKDCDIVRKGHRSDSPPPDWADGVDAAAGVIRAEMAQKHPKPLGAILTCLETLAENYPGRRT